MCVVYLVSRNLQPILAIAGQERSGIFSAQNVVPYLEYTKFVNADKKVSYLSENKGAQHTFSLPYGNMAVLLLGLGTSITQSAMHHLCAESCLVGFTGGARVRSKITEKA